MHGSFRVFSMVVVGVCKNRVVCQILYLYLRDYSRKYNFVSTIFPYLSVFLAFV